MIQFVPMELEHIDYGYFQEKLNTLIRQAQTELAEYRETHGEKSKGGTIKIQAEVAMTIEDPEDGTTRIKANVNLARPKDPPSFTRGNITEGQDGEKCLFVKTGITPERSNKLQKTIPFDPNADQE